MFFLCPGYPSDPERPRHDRRGQDGQRQDSGVHLATLGTHHGSGKEGSGMSFCHGSVNCHLSDGKIDHFCESSKSVEIFTGVDGGVGVGGHQHMSLINHQLSCQCYCLYLVTRQQR